MLDRVWVRHSAQFSLAAGDTFQLRRSLERPSHNFVGGEGMILRPQVNFSGNGVLKGTVTAYDDSGEPLGWEQYGNWSAPKFREHAIQDLATSTGISVEKAQALLARMLKAARKDAHFVEVMWDTHGKRNTRAYHGVFVRTVD